MYPIVVKYKKHSESHFYIQRMKNVLTLYYCKNSAECITSTLLVWLQSC
uniref:Uncharacterized protein n=1 Tax=Anguilla anguilla TaxID=7936 RepID=A0A0E9P8R1_ANGAN